MKSLIEGYVGADHTNFSSLKTIPLNFGREHWELLWDHIFDKLHCKRKTPVTSRYTRKMSECTGMLPEFQECTGGLPDFFILLKLQFCLSR